MRLPLSVVIPDPLLPIAVRAEKLFAGLLRPPALFVGSPCADEGAIGLLPCWDRRAVLLCLQHALEKRMAELGTSRLVWKDLPTSLADDLTWLGARSGLFRSTSYPGTLVTLPRSRAVYLASLSTSRRQRYKRMLRRSQDRLDVAVAVIQRPDAHTLREIFGLFQQAYDYGRTKFEVLNGAFFEQIAQEPVSTFIVLRERSSGQMVAFMLCFVLGDRVINKFVGIDCTRPRNHFLKVRLWDAVVDWALTIGASAI